MTSVTVKTEIELSEKVVESISCSPIEKPDIETNNSADIPGTTPVSLSPQNTQESHRKSGLKMSLNFVKVPIEVINVPLEELVHLPQELRDGISPGEFIQVPVPLLQKYKVGFVGSGFLTEYRGMLLALASSLLFSLTALIVKFLKNYHPFTIALWRYQGALLPSVIMLIYKEVKYRRSWHIRITQFKVTQNRFQSPIFANVYPWTDGKKFKMSMLVLLRSFLTCNALLLHFYSLKYLEMGDALVISSSTPVFVTLFAHIFLGEKCGLVPIFSAIMTVLGVIVIARPPHIFGHEEFDRDTMIGTALALGCMLVATVSYIVLRYIRKVHYAVTNLAFGGWGTFESLVLAIVFGVLSWPHCYKDWIAAVTLASLTFVGQLAIINAMKAEQAGPVALVRTCDVIFAFFWQICVLDCWPEIYSWIGCSIVAFSLIATALRKWVASLDQTDINRKRFNFILL